MSSFRLNPLTGTEMRFRWTWLEETATSKHRLYLFLLLIYTWLSFGSTIVLWCLCNAIALALFDWLIVVSETMMSYVVLVSCSMCRYPGVTANGLWFSKAGARGYYFFYNDDSIGFQVGRSTMSLVHSLTRKKHFSMSFCLWTHPRATEIVSIHTEDLPMY